MHAQGGWYLHSEVHGLDRVVSTIGLDIFTVGLLDGPQRVIVIIHGESSNGLLSASSGIVDVM